MGNSWLSTQQNRAVEAYLAWINKQELPPDPALEARIAEMDTRIERENRMFVKVQLVQQKHELLAPAFSPETLTADFVKHAAGFSERQHPKITYATWREMGVPPKVLAEAHIRGGTVSHPKLDPDDPERQRPYVPRRPWSMEEKKEYVRIYDAEGVEAAMAHFDVKSTEKAAKQRYFGFRRQLGLSPATKRGRPRKNAG